MDHLLRCARQPKRVTCPLGASYSYTSARCLLRQAMRTLRNEDQKKHIAHAGLTSPLGDLGLIAAGVFLNAGTDRCGLAICALDVFP